MIKHIEGDVEIRPYTAPASTAFAFNDVVTRDANGRLAKATSSTPRSEILGLIQQTIASTDSDYASTKTVPVLLVCECEADFEADVDTGSLTTAMVGQRFDLNDENGINVSSQGQKSVEIVRYLSATKARVKFVVGGDKMRLVSYQQTITRAQMTDGGSTSGTIDLSTSIPAGAVFARAVVSALTGFTGDTSAALTIGDGTTADRYNTGTPSVFTTAAAGADVGAPSGTLFHSAAKTPKLTITSNSDFTLVTAGQLTVTLFYYAAA
jgi:hypothetical protein